MNRSGRRRHRLIVTALLGIVPVGVVIGLLAREPVPAMHPTDPALHGLRRFAVPPGTNPSEEGWSLVGGLDLGVQLSTDGEQRHLDLYPGPETLAPDVLVYHSASAVVAGGDLPGDALLLGSLAGLEPRRLPFPSDRSAGHLILYSLGHARLLGSTPVPLAGTETPFTGDASFENSLPSKASPSGS